MCLRFIVPFLLLPNIALADCISDCIAAKDCSLSYSGACSSALSDCSISCTGSQGPAFGALAYDRGNGAFGFSYQFGNAKAAESFALKNCAETGDACEVVATFSDSCAALAAGKRDGEPVTATVIGGTEQVVQEKAVANCAEMSEETCEIQVWSCSYP